MRPRLLHAPLLCALLAPLPSLAAEPHPITHEDVWLMRRLGTPVLSPDGSQAVFPVTEPSYDSEETTSDLWLVETDGSAPPRQLTATGAAESDAVWSPDGTRLAFSSKREGDDEAQIYVLDMTGPGEALRLTDLSTGARAPKWSPDGSRIAFESHVYPGTADDEANREEKERREGLDYDVSAYDGFPVRQWDHWRNDRQVHLLVQEAKEGAEARDLLAGTALVQGPGFGGRPTRSSDELEAVWTPDGSALVVTVTRNRHQAANAFVRYELARVSLEGGEPQVLDTGAGSLWSPRFSPDGKHLYSLFEPIDDFAYHQNRLVRFAWSSASGPSGRRVVSERFDRSVGDFTLSADGDRIWVTANDSGRVPLFELPAAGGTARRLDPGSGGVYAGLRAATASRGPLVARWEDAVQPAEIVRIDPETGRHEPLTSFNVERASQIDWRPFRELWFTSSKGRRIHSFLALPPGFDEDAKYPLVLFIHGGPHSSSLDSSHVRWSAHLMAAPGYVVLMTDYTGSVGYGEAFSQAIQEDPLRTPGEELLEAVDVALERFPFLDGDRLAATGASYGGHLVNWLQATSDRFRCLVGHAGLVDLEGQWATSDVIYHREIMNGGPPWGESPIWREQSPSTYAGRFSTPQLLTIGEQDYRVPLNQTLAAWSYLQRRQVPSRLVVFHDANHWIMKGGDARHFWEEVHAWLEHYLGPES